MNEYQYARQLTTDRTSNANEKKRKERKSSIKLLRNAVRPKVENMHLICIVRDSKGIMKKERKPSLLSFIVFVNTPFGTRIESDLIAIISFVKKEERK
jgi:hypothetical protein